MNFNSPEKANYKRTLNIPFTNFPMKGNLVNNLKKFKCFWEEIEIYTHLKTRNSKTFILHDGPPYANGNIHVGHALNKILKDFVLRYKSLTGHKIEYVPGWDTHGLPIENRLEKDGKYKGKSITEKRKECKKYALEQIEIQKEQFKQLNLLCDFKETYKTLDPKFINSELEIFYKFIEKNLIYWDLKPVAWSWSSKTALAESEIIYKEVESHSVYFWFPLSKKHKDIPENTRLLIWTTTPYTIEANLAISINPRFEYALIKSEENFWIVLSSKTTLFKSIKIIKTFLGSYLEGAKYKNSLTNEENLVILGEHVTEEAGTGLVHTAPGFGLEDYKSCLNHLIKPYCSIEDSGHFINKTKFPPINNLFYTKASLVIIEQLKSSGNLFLHEKIMHRAGHDWRTEKPIIYRASPQWFINIQKIKPSIKGLSKQIETIPEWIGDSLENLICSRNEWCISRQRAWGIPIPILFLNGKPILELEQIKKNIDLIKEWGVDSWFEKDPKSFLLKKYGENEKVETCKDVLDVWFDSGCSWNILSETPSDLYLEGFDQLRGWFNSSATISIAVKEKLPFKTILSHGFVLDKQGNKMSKSRGNVIDPIKIANEKGSDILRLWLATNNYLEDIKLSETSLENSVNIYRKIRNTLFRYSLSVLGENFKPNKQVLKNLKKKENKYIYFLFKKSLQESKEQLESFCFFKAVQINLNFLNLYSSWYLEICKDILYCDDKNSEEYQEIINIVHEIFSKSVIFWSIFIPQTAEEAYGYSPTKKEKSVFLESFEEMQIQEEIENMKIWKKFFEIKDEVYSKIETLKNEKKLIDSTEALVFLPKDKCIKELDMKKLLNVAEIKEGDLIFVCVSKLEKCERCRRKKELEKTNICKRCEEVMNLKKIEEIH